ncbi:MAG TPA: hypothetical protein VNL36_00340 [Bacteroidota bacterium]|nr:hypothetical protein [Bacteroidota bacterium]
MNHIRSAVAVIAILTLSHALYSQNNFRLQAVGGVSFNALTTGVFSNWRDGWTFGGGASYPISPSIELGLNIAYSHHAYRGDNLQLVFPAVAGFQWSVAGQPSNVIEASITARASTEASFINPFLSLTTGLYRLNIGEIIISTWFDSNPQNVSRSTYNGSGVSSTKGFAALGLGFSIPLDSSIRIALEGRFTQTFNSQESFIPLLTRIQFDL